MTPMMTTQYLYNERLAAWSDIQGHLEFMHDLVVSENAQNVVELGVRSGNSTAALLYGVEKTGGRLWSVDIVHPDWPKEFFSHPQSLLVLGNDTDPDVLVKLPEQIDICFIDTSHHYDHTLLELRKYGPRSRILLLHDTALDRPYGAPKTDPTYPVRSAIGVYVNETGRSVEYRYGSYGMGIVR